MKELELETNYEVQIILEPNEKMFASDVYAIMIRNLIKNANEKSTCTIFDKDGIKQCFMCSKIGNKSSKCPN